MVYDKICLMLPTYKRPKWLDIFISSALKAADDVRRVQFAFCVNADDMDTLSALDFRYWPVADNWEVIKETTEQPNLALYFNMLYEQTKFNAPGTLVSMVGDDMCFRTPGWDTRALKEVNDADGSAIVYFNDNYIAHEKLCVNLFTTRKIVDATEKPFMCPRFHADMIDVVWMDIGLCTGTLRYCADVVLQHNHSTRTPIEKWDETFKRLSPVQKIHSTDADRRYALQYATRCAAKLIEKGVGRWNLL